MTPADLNAILAEMRGRAELVATFEQADPGFGSSDDLAAFVTMIDTGRAIARTDLPNLLAFAQWVIDHHFPDDCEPPGPHCDYDGERWPCEHITSLTSALGGGDE